MPVSPPKSFTAPNFLAVSPHWIEVFGEQVSKFGGQEVFAFFNLPLYKFEQLKKSWFIPAGPGQSVLAVDLWSSKLRSPLRILPRFPREPDNSIVLTFTYKFSVQHLCGAGA